MKFSQFNTAVLFENKIVYNNSYTQNFLLLDPLLFDLMEAARLEDNIEGLKEIHEDLYSCLLTQGFILPSDEDEILKVKKLISEIDGNETSFFLIVNPTMNCNFKCWYCYESHIKGSRMDEVNVEKIRLFVEGVFKANTNLKEFTLSFFGGEPLLYFYDVIIPVIENTKLITDGYGAQLKVGFTTNGLLINEDVINKLLKYTLTGFQISFDGNKEHHDMTRYVSKNRGSYDDIIRNVKLLVINGISVTLRINYTEKNIGGLESILIDLNDLSDEEKNRIMVSMNKVWQEQNENLWPIVKNFYAKVEEYGFNETDPLLGDTLRNSCYADKKNEAVVNYNGDIYKCNARDFKKENRAGYLNDEGEIVWTTDINERLSIKLENKPCLECSIMPICAGGCSQVAMENKGKEYCVNDFDEERKKSIILEMFLSKRLKHV